MMLTEREKRACRYARNAEAERARRREKYASMSADEKRAIHQEEYQRNRDYYLQKARERYKKRLYVSNQQLKKPYNAFQRVFDDQTLIEEIKTAKKLGGIDEF